MSMTAGAIKQRRLNAANPGRKAARQREWYANNHERALENHRRWARENPEKVKRINQRSNTKRATLLSNATSDGFVRQEIFDRDRWSCQAEDCKHPRGRTINPKAPKKSRWSACVIHVAPLTASGDDTSTNVVAAHYACACALGGRTPRDVSQTEAVV
jgi:hypothetical protein